MPILQSVWQKFPELVDQMKEMLKKGWSSSLIADNLGHGIGRNAVIGKTNRLGLTRNKKNDHVVAARAHVAARRFKVDAFHPLTEYEEVTVAPPTRDTEIPMEQRRTILSVGKNECRFPVGEPADADFFLCGGTPVVPGSPYCRHHTMRSFTKSPPRSDGYFSMHRSR
jgi:GcrA cell cycle regulator